MTVAEIPVHIMNYEPFIVVVIFWPTPCYQIRPISYNSHGAREKLNSNWPGVIFQMFTEGTLTMCNIFMHY